jgi:putative peptide zinc metalloprotease protein
MEFDGYYVLSDWLDRPNLRQDALRWLGTGLPAALRTPARFHGHWLELLYGCLALGYLVALPFMVVGFYGAALQAWLSAILPPSLVAALGWLAAAGVTGLFFLAIAGNLRPNSRLNFNNQTRSRQ